MCRFFFICGVFYLTALGKCFSFVDGISHLAAEKLDRTDRIVVGGHSAGGHLALWAAATLALPRLLGVLALVAALYAGDESVHVEAQVKYEDGRSGSISADLKIRDAKTFAPAAAKQAA